MSDVMFVFRKPTISKEVTPGTHVTPTKQLGSLEIAPSYAPTVVPFRPMGYLINSVGATNYEETTAPIRGQGDFNEAPYWLSSLIHATTPTTPGGGTLSREWLYNLDTSSEHTPATFSVEVGSERRAASLDYLLMNEVGYTVNFDQGMQITGNAFARKMIDDKRFYITVTGGPATTGTWSLTVNGQTAASLAKDISAAALQTAIEALSNVAVGDVTVTGGALQTAVLVVTFQLALAETEIVLSAVDTFDAGDIAITRLAPAVTANTLKPILGSQFNYSFAAAQSGLAGATPATRIFGFNFRLGGRWAPIKPMNRANNGTFAAHGETVPESTVGWTAGADSNGMAFLASLRNNTPVFLQVQAQGPLIEGSLNYLFQHQMCVLLTRVQPISDGGNGLAQIGFEGTLLHDPTWGRAMSVLNRNILTAL
jgi:hypothetical protein